MLSFVNKHFLLLGYRLRVCNSNKADKVPRNLSMAIARKRVLPTLPHQAALPQGNLLQQLPQLPLLHQNYLLRQSPNRRWKV